MFCVLALNVICVRWVGHPVRDRIGDELGGAGGTGQGGEGRRQPARADDPQAQARQEPDRDQAAGP